MAISPTVQQYQDQDLETQSTDADSLFKQKFGDAAYKVLQSKFAPILPYVVTFKVIETNVDEGQGVGAFVVKKGKDLIYIPVVLSEGSIESCEMFYDKTTDTFVPASKKEIDKLIATNRLGSYELTSKVPRDMTQQTFRNMFRPPVSSRPMTMASSSNHLEELPNKAKKAISAYLEQNPTLLAKIAEFYPVEVLGAKLAEVHVTETQIKVAEEIPEVISISELTKEAIAKLTADDKDDLLGDGFLFPTTPKAAPVVYVKKQLPVEAVTKLDLVEIPLTKGDYNRVSNNRLNPVDLPICSTFVKGTIFCTGGTYLKNKTGILTQHCFLNEDGTYERINLDSMVMSSPDTEIKADDLLKVGAKNITDITFPDATRGKLHIFFKKKNNTYGHLEHTPVFSTFTTPESVPTVRNIDGNVVVSTEYEWKEILFTDELTYGYIKTEDSVILPKESTLVYITDNNSTNSVERPIATIYELLKFFEKLGRSLRLVGDSVSMSLRDSQLKKVANFSNKKALYNHLYRNYSFDKTAATALVEHKEVIFFDKVAEVDPYIAHMAQAADSPLMPTEDQDQPLINPNMIQDAAAMGDQDLMDTGLIASVANTGDIKMFLLDMLPDFIKTVTDIGKAILLYVIKAPELKEYYSVEEYANFLGALRRIFTNLGDIVVDLRAYTNNSQ